MKIVRGIIRDGKVEDVLRALEKAGATGLTITKAVGRGAEERVAVYRGVPYRALCPMSVVDVIVDDRDAEEMARALASGAHTGQTGDGHVCVIGLDESYAVRTCWPRVA